MEVVVYLLAAVVCSKHRCRLVVGIGGRTDQTRALDRHFGLGLLEGESVQLLVTHPALCPAKTWWGAALLRLDFFDLPLDFSDLLVWWWTLYVDCFRWG